MYNMVQISKKGYEKCEVMRNTEFQPSRRFVQNDLVKRKLKSCRKSSKKFLQFKKSSD